MKRKKWLLFLILLLAVVVFPFFFSRNSSYLSVIEANWELTFPEDARWKLLYQADSGPSPHGDGWRYHVYAYEQEEVAASMLPWSRETGKTVFQESYSLAAETWLNAIQVPQEERPDYDACLVWFSSQHDNSQILIFRDPQRKTLYVAENFL